MILNTKENLEKVKNIKVFVLDMDGTIYLGEKILKGAIEFVKNIKNSDKKILYFTNNASRSKKVYLDKLHRLGFPAEFDEIVTSGDVTAKYLVQNHPNEKVYLVGTPDLENVFREYGINLSDGSDADIVVSSFDTTLTYEKLVNACNLIRDGAIFYSTHPDFNCPLENGFIPDSGAICALITASTDKHPRYFGKPHRESAEMMAELCGVGFEDMAMVGDRLYTDIALGKDNGIFSVLVLSGETKIEDVNEDNRGDLVLEGIFELDLLLFG